MASFDLFVDPAEVRSAGRKAALIADDLALSTSPGATTEAIASFEGWQVVSRLRACQESWAQRISGLNSRLAAIADRLLFTATQYEQAESEATAQISSVLTALRGR